MTDILDTPQLCEDCPAIKEMLAAKEALKDQVELHFIDPESAEVATIRIERYRIAVEATAKHLICPKPQTDEKTKSLYCPLTWGRIAYLVNGNEEHSHDSAWRTAKQNGRQKSSGQD